ncbi:polyprenyl synthetase family protein [Halobacillus litoralis]|uniref:polyprenyl synthetase family protein n=1 Tax=Halobacillus litoralis TaxID=45668 RepID=UPI001CD62BBA|nr:polyprenyl synthetase family protein [Halobacillus litoralis]MCA0971395.1 polyprenyl synthetase family protein [Halobacillus litoralis]
MVPSYSVETLTSRMIHAVNSCWHQSDLSERLEQWIAFKREEGFSFSRLTQLHFHMYQKEESEHVLHLSASVELMMLALDVMDDLQDQDNMNQPWMDEPSVSMNMATGLLFLSLDELRHTSCQPAIYQMVHKQVLQAVHGQHRDLMGRAASEEAFLDVIKNKSGALMAFAALVGAGAVTSKDHELIRIYMEDFGVAAQLANDLHDLLRMDEKNDLLNRKWTLATMLLTEEKGEENFRIKEYYEGRMSPDFLIEEKESLFDWVGQSTVIPYMKVMIRFYQRKALNTLYTLNVDPSAKEEMKRTIHQLYPHS